MKFTISMMVEPNAEWLIMIYRPFILLLVHTKHFEAWAGIVHSQQVWWPACISIISLNKSDVGTGWWVMQCRLRRLFLFKITTFLGCHRPRAFVMPVISAFYITIPRYNSVHFLGSNQITVNLCDAPSTSRPNRALAPSCFQGIDCNRFRFWW